MEILIVDVNVVISSLLNEGIPFKVFFLNSLINKFILVAPEFLLSEFEKHEKDLIRETNFSEEEFKEIKDFIFEQITFIPYSEFLEFLPKAEELLKQHEKDAPYVALSLKIESPIFSGDKILKKIIPERVLSPREVFDIFIKNP